MSRLQIESLIVARAKLVQNVEVFAPMDTRVRAQSLEVLAATLAEFEHAVREDERAAHGIVLEAVVPPVYELPPEAPIDVASDTPPGVDANGSPVDVYAEAMANINAKAIADAAPPVDVQDGDVGASESEVTAKSKKRK